MNHLRTFRKIERADRKVNIIQGAALAFFIGIVITSVIIVVSCFTGSCIWNR